MEDLDDLIGDLVAEIVGVDWREERIVCGRLERLRGRS